MTGTTADAPDDLIGTEEASTLLEVAPDPIALMVSEGMLTPVGDGELQFTRAEVIAARELDT